MKNIDEVSHHYIFNRTVAQENSYVFRYAFFLKSKREMPAFWFFSSQNWVVILVVGHASHARPENNVKHYIFDEDFSSSS